MSLRVLRNSVLLVGGVVALYAVVGAFALPPIARKIVVERTAQALGRTTSLENVTFNPFTLEATLNGFRVMEADGRTPFASFDRLALDVSSLSLWHRAPVADAVTLAGLRVKLARDGDTHYNFSDIVERLAVAARPHPGDRKEEPARFSVANLRLVDGAIDFDDGPNRTKHSVSAIQLAIPLVSNLPRNVREFVQPSFSATVDGSPFAVRGESLPFDPTMRSRFNVEIRGVDLAKFAAYVPADAPAKITAGKLDAAISVRFSEGARGEPAIDVTGRSTLSDVSFANDEGQLGTLGKLEAELSSLDPLGGVGKIGSLTLADVSLMQGQWKAAWVDLRNIALDLRKHRVRIDSFASSGGDVTLERQADKSIAVPRFVSKGPPTHWDAALGKADIQSWRVTWIDNAVKPGLTQAIAIASLTAKDLSSDGGGKGEAAIRAKIERGGSIDAASSFTMEPLQVKGTVDVRGIDLAPYRAYVTSFPAVAIRSGAASAKGSFALSGKPESLHVSYEGDAAIDRLVTVDTINKEDLLDWKSLKTRGIQLAFAPGSPLRVAVADLAVDGAYSRLVITPEGKLNVQQLISATEDNPAPAAPPGPPKPRDVRIDKITFTNSRLHFTDHFIKPNYTADVGSLHGSVTKLSSDPSSRATVALQGEWDKSSPVLIAGTVNPLRGDLFVDVAAKAQEIDLTRLTAYSERYAGYGVKEGRLTLDVKYHVDGGTLEGRNRIVVDKLAFGDKVQSPEATKLPVLFAVNLLKDRNGRIDLELPISGSLDDPKFEIGAVIAQVFGSRMKKAESSPFSLIAAGATDNPDELAYVEFAPGSAELTDAARGKLDTLVKILDDRPGVKLAMAARVDDAADVEAMKAALRAEKLAALPKDATQEARTKVEAEPIELTAEQREALMKQRGEGVRAYLCAAGRLPEERVVLATEPIKAEGVKAKLTRVDFALR